jgi:hypothetical protein
MIKKIVKITRFTDPCILQQCYDIEEMAFGFVSSMPEIMSGTLKGIARMVNDNVVGGIMYYKDLRRHMYIDTLVTHPKYENKRIASSMIDLLVVVSKIMGYTKIWTKIHKDTGTPRLLSFYCAKNKFTISRNQEIYTSKIDKFIVVERILKSSGYKYTQPEYLCKYNLFGLRRFTI